MSEADAALREMAANRGCRLVASRIRTPGKGDYGRFGLKDAKTGRDLFGFGEAGLTATAAEIEAFLRGDSAAGWKQSVGSAKRAPKAKAPPKAKPPPAARPAPRLVIRDARPADAPAIAALIVALGYDVSATEVRTRLAALRKGGQAALVADRGGLLGVLTTSVMTVLHRPHSVGRISMLVVAEAARGEGLGRALVAAAEKRLAAAGCGLIEVTSNAKRLRAHAFYEKLGYERTSYRFAKPL